jgi:VWFA-related protein
MQCLSLPRAFIWICSFILLASASAEAQRRFPHQFNLDSRSLDTLRTPDATDARHRYRITAWGTYSMWEDTVNSSVDPMWIYSFPAEEWAKPEWRLFGEGYPIYVGDERLLDAHGLRINNKALPKQPLNNAHRYSTVIQGTGQPITAAIVDWNFRNFVKQDAHGNNSGWLYVLVEELPLTEMEICGIDASKFPTIRVAMKVTRESVRMEDFAEELFITENGVPVKIDKVDCSERSNEVSVAMVFDRSGSMREPFGTSDRITHTRAAGKKFVDKLAPSDETAIYSFSEGTTLDQSWTNSIPLLRSAIDRLQPEGWTAMNDAVITAINDISRRPASRRKAIVLLSDGEDNRSQVRSIGTVIARAKQAGVPVFAIGLLLDTDDSLKLLAAQTGGRYFSVRDPAAMDSVFASIAEIVFAKGCCSIYYTSPDARRNGTQRQVIPALTYDGDTLASGTLGYTAPTGPSSVREEPESVGAILGVVPNPLRESGDLRYMMKRSGPVTIDVIDVQGKVVAKVYEGYVGAGEHTQPVTVAGLPDGRYFVRLRLPAEVAIYPLLLVR